MDNSLEPQTLHIHTTALQRPLSDDLCHSMPSSRGLLQPMPTEPVDEDEIAQNRMRANDAVLIKRIVVIVTCPRTP